ncbi:MAG: four helix bundle protein [Kofleriaceae bacterium]
MSHQPNKSCEVLCVAEELIRALRPIVSACDADLANQLRRAATSAALNAAEAWRRAGRDRAMRLRVAHAECHEAVAAIRVAVAWGYVADAEATLALHTADRLGAMLYRLRVPRS